MGKEIYDSLIQKAELEIMKKKLIKRRELLEKYQLYTKVYGPQSSEYNNSAYENNKLVYYKKVYEEVSNEELEKLETLLQLSLGLSSVETFSVRFGATNFIGYMYIIVGVLIGIVLLATELPEIGFMVIFASIVIGIAFLTAGHIIRQLNIIINNLKKLDKDS
jgi:hypothetical protein